MSGLEEEGGISMDLFVLVLLFSMASTLNLFTKSDQGTLFASCSAQNPPLPEGPLSQKRNPSKPANLLSASSAAPLLVVLYLNNGGSPRPSGECLHSGSSLLEAAARSFKQCLCPWLLTEQGKWE